MENGIELSKVLDTHDELKDVANIYYKCINLNGIESEISFIEIWSL